MKATADTSRRVVTFPLAKLTTIVRLAAERLAQPRASTQAEWDEVVADLTAVLGERGLSDYAVTRELIAFHQAVQHAIDSRGPVRALPEGDLLHVLRLRAWRKLVAGSANGKRLSD